jgi:hypothetical protein
MQVSRTQAIQAGNRQSDSMVSEGSVRLYVHIHAIQIVPASGTKKPGSWPSQALVDCGAFPTMDDTGAVFYDRRPTGAEVK